LQAHLTIEIATAEEVFVTYHSQKIDPGFPGQNSRVGYVKQSLARVEEGEASRADLFRQSGRTVAGALAKQCIAVFSCAVNERRKDPGETGMNQLIRKAP
jgi:hypothetical protein